MDLLSEARKQEMEQLSAQILLHVATVTCQRGDPHQAREMLQSSITLAQGINDLQTSRNAIELLGSKFGASLTAPTGTCQRVRSSILMCARLEYRYASRCRKCSR
eukprot:scaffold7998_cov417-Prasinococcus_capsulatus_cf.AAC.3